MGEIADQNLAGQHRRFLWLGIVGGLMVLAVAIYVHVTEVPLGSVEHRRDFHARQLDFQARCQANNVVGKKIEDVFNFFDGRPAVFTYGEDWECDWKQWPCELVVRRGVVQAVFYHDYPYAMQRLPLNYKTKNDAPYFSRNPEQLGPDWIWDNSQWGWRKAPK